MTRIRLVVLIVTMTAIGAICDAPVSVADPTSHLRAEIDGARSESGCAPFQTDAALTEISQRIATEVDEYVRHAARVLPPSTDTDLLQVLRQSGYNTVNARLLNGYGDYRTGGTGDNEAKAIKAAVLEGRGFEALPDCTLTRYGLGAINNDGSGGWPSTQPRTYSVVVVILAGANGQ